MYNRSKRPWILLFAVFVLIVSLAIVLTWTVTAQGPRTLDIPPEIASRFLQKSGYGRVGQQVSLSGWFTIIWGDGKPGSKATEIIYMLTDDSGQSTQVLLVEELARPLGGILALNGQHVTIVGAYESTPTEAARTRIVRAQSIWLKPVAKASVTALVAPVRGSQPWVSIMCKFADVVTETRTLSYFQGMYSNTYPGLDHYWRELSYNAINLVGSNAVGWYTLPHPKSYYVYDKDGDGELELDHGKAATDCTAVADASVYFPSFVGINLMFNDNLDCCAWGGGWYGTLDGVSKGWRMTWEPPWGYANQTVMVHETGHGFGLPHSGNANSWDIMSEGWRYCDLSSDPVYGCLGQHTISYHKDLLGWVTTGQKYVATAFSQTVTLEQLALPQTGNYLMAQIPITSSSTHFYTVETRRKAGYDVKLPGQAVIIHEVDTTSDVPAHVIDADGNGDTGDDGAMWTVGETFSDVANRISVSVNSATATGFVVTIRFKPTPTQLSPAENNVMPVGNVTFTWTLIRDATGYEIQVDNVPTFNSPGLITQTVTGTSHSRSFTTLGVYYWRVRALPDGGYSSTWRFDVLASPVQVSSSPDWEGHVGIAQGDGLLWTVWERCCSSDRLWYATSVNSGATWSEPQALTDQSSDDQPSMATDHAGQAWLVFQSLRSGNWDIWGMHTTGGGNWTTPSRITTDPAADEDPVIVQAADGTFLVAFESSRSGNEDIWLASSADGLTWSTPVQMTSDLGYDADVELAKLQDGTLWMIWHSDKSPWGLWARSSADNGHTWSTPQPIVQGYGEWQPALEQDYSGKLWLVWLAHRSGNDDLWYATSTDNGANWSKPLQFTRFKGRDWRPALTSLPTGTSGVGLAWASERSAWANERSENFDVWFARLGAQGDVNPPPYVYPAYHLPGPNPDSLDIVTARAYVTDETAISSVTLLWTRDGTPQTSLTMHDDGGHDDYAAGDSWYGARIGPFPVGTQIAYQVRAVDSNGNGLTWPMTATTFTVLRPFTKTTDLLFVADRGPYEDTASFRGYYTQTLADGGWAYDFWDVYQRGAPDSSILNQYTNGVVIWASPEWSACSYWQYNYCNRNDTINTLRSYLDAGGRLFISGQNIGEILCNESFYRDYLHAQHVQADTNLYRLNGVVGDPIGDGLTLNISGGDGANNQWSPDAINPITPAVSIFTYDTTATAPLAEPVKPATRESLPEAGWADGSIEVVSGTAGLRVDAGTYKVVYLAFGFEAINSATDRALVIERVLAWLQGVPPRPTQLSPAKGSAVPVGDVAFTWTTVAGASGYQVQIDTTTAFTSPVLISATVSTTSYTATLTMGTWYWRVHTLPNGEWPVSWQVRAVRPLVQVTSGADNDTNAALVSTADGHLISIWQRNGELWTARSTDFGETWSATTRLAGCCRSAPAMLRAADNKIWLVFGKDNDLWYRTSSDGGLSWASEVRLTTRPEGDGDPDLAQTADGRIWVIWYGEGGSNLWYKTTSDNGTSWSPDTELPVDLGWNTHPTMVQAPNGTLWVVWFRGYGLAYTTSTDGGNTWVPLGFFNAGGPVHGPNLRRATDGTLWLVYPVTRYEYGQWRTHLYYQTSGDSGATWFGFQQFTSYTGDNSEPVFAPVNNGRMGLVFHSDRSGDYDIWFGIPNLREDITAADFSASPTSGAAPLMVVFTNISTGGYIASLWDFGDGVTSTLKSPTHTYTAVGVYTVTLMVSGPAGSDTETKAAYITVWKWTNTATPTYTPTPTPTSTPTVTPTPTPTNTATLTYRVYLPLVLRKH